ncbi:MAG: hypothetical protein WAW36_10085 [Methylovulum miyakonense]|uniref:hypothetical protein n=1 Tax=Methylovulum miyakonense TaxID=645578 RepID=UPI003BB741C3
MNGENTELSQWLAGFGQEQVSDGDGAWDPGFDAERRIVHFRLGFFDRLYLRPENFKQRFYHKLYPLEIATWNIVAHSQLYDGFCRIETTLDIRFQATAQYAMANRDVLGDINGHIKTAYEGLVRDAIDRGLLALSDGAWIDSGLNGAENHIAEAVNELLILKNVQCRTFCSLKPTFEEFSEDKRLDSRFAQESLYLNVLKKNFEFREKQQQERLRQEQALENQKLLFKQTQLQHLRQADEIERAKASQSAQSFHLILKDKEKLQLEQFEIEKRLHEEKIKYEQSLKEQEWLAVQQLEESLLAKKRLAEKDGLQEKLAHDNYLKEQALADELKAYEREQASWDGVKERVHIENIKREQRLKELEWQLELNHQEQQQQIKLKMQEKLLLDKLNTEANLKGIELMAQVEERQKRFEATHNDEEYLRKEIELLILEKQRAELSNQVKQAENKGQ